MGVLSGEERYKRYIDGENEAFDDIIALYREGLTHFLYGILKDPNDAEEAAEDAFAALVIDKRRFNFRSSLKSYLYSIGRHKAMDILRRRKRAGALALYEEGTPSLLPTPEEAALEDEEKRLLHDALGRLNENYRLALHLVYFDNMNSAEAAKVMGKTKKQAENYLYRGKIALKALLSPPPGE